MEAAGQGWLTGMGEERGIEEAQPGVWIEGWPVNEEGMGFGLRIM